MQDINMNISEKAYMDSIILSVPYQGGYQIFSNHEEIKTVDENGEEHISYVADVEWVKELKQRQDEQYI